MAEKLEVRFLIDGDHSDQPEGQQKPLSARIEPGSTLYDAALLADAPLVTTCGGKGTCGKCRVHTQGVFSAPTLSERDCLSQADLAAGYRLACQAVPQSDAVVTLVPASRSLVILTRGAQSPLALKPNARRIHLEIPYPVRLRSEAEAVLRWLQQEGYPNCRFLLSPLQNLSAALRQGRGRLTLTLIGREIVAVKAGDLAGAAGGISEAGPAQPDGLYGMAFDIGTTTVAGYLLDLERGQRMAVVSAPNPQSAFGADVITRLTYAIEQRQNLERLSVCIREALNRLLAQAARLAGIAIGQIFEVTVVGNTSMQHLFLGANPSGLLYAPYTPAVVQPVELSAQEAGLSMAEHGRVWVLPNIGGFVGADTLGVILATGLDRSAAPRLAIDIGTNGEMVLGARGRLLACSTAAGPAFEGAHIHAGMVAAEGAIDQVQVVDRTLRLHTIGGVPPKGICGSGLVDLAAVLLEEGLLQPNGRLVPPDRMPPAALPELADRMITGERGAGLRLYEAGERQVTLIQKDIRELQLAKGAIRSGIEILLKELGVEREEVDEVFLAGAFGNYIRPESACRIGLLPDFPHARITPVGNAAGTGSQMALLSTAVRRRATRLAPQVEYIDLATRPEFQMEFAAAMHFPGG